MNVLISLYNGERHICEQIESILSQSYSNIKIYIRDDGSKDKTLKRIKQNYAMNDFFLYEEQNVGFGRSFYKLLSYAQEGAYWTFCDQDDIWGRDKVKWAVEWMERQNENIPLLFHSSYEMVDERGKKSLGVMGPPKYKVDFRRLLTDCVYQGFSIMINRKLREKMMECTEENMVSHDRMAGILASKFGKDYFDPRIAVKHRRLDSSLSSMKMRNRLYWLFQTLSNPGKSDIVQTAREFDRVFGNQINDRECEMARWFAHENYNLKDAVKKAFYPGRWRPSLASEIILRILMITGKV